jgi:hypothetical protein
VILPYIYIMYFYQIHPVYYPFWSSFPLLETIFIRFHFNFLMFIWSISIIFAFFCHSDTASYLQTVPLLQLAWITAVNHHTQLYTYFFLSLDSTYETEYVIFVFLSLADFTSDDYVQFHPFLWKLHNFILLYGWMKLQCL